MGSQLTPAADPKSIRPPAEFEVAMDREAGESRRKK